MRFRHLNLKLLGSFIEAFHLEGLTTSSEPWLLLSSALYFPILLLHLPILAGRFIFKDEALSGDNLLPTPSHTPIT